MEYRELGKSDKSFLDALLNDANAPSKGVGRAEKVVFAEWCACKSNSGKDNKIRLIVVSNYRFYSIKNKALRGLSVQQNLHIFVLKQLTVDERIEYTLFWISVFICFTRVFVCYSSSGPQQHMPELSQRPACHCDLQL